MDYDNTLVSWKLPLKKSIEVKIDDIEPMTSQHNNVPLISIPSTISTSHGSLQITHLSHFDLIPTQHIQTNHPQQNLQPQHHIQQLINDSKIEIHHHLNDKIEIHQHHLHEHQQQTHQQHSQQHEQPQLQQPHQQQQQMQQQQPKQKRFEKTKDRINKKNFKMRKIPLVDMAYHSKQFGLKVPPKKTLGIKGMVISKQTREVIHNVYKFMKDEAQNGTKIPIANYRERVLAATGISKCTYSKITSKEFVNGVLIESMLPKQKKTGINISKTAIDSNLSENDSIYRPKINRDASSRDGVYNLEDLVPFRVLSTLENDALAVINMGLSEELSQFVSSSILKILNSGIAPPVMLRKITIFLYIHYLIKFINTPMKHVTKKFVICEKSAEVNNHILDNFSVNSQNGRTRPVHIKDKSLCFIVVLAAIAMDYEVDLANLSKDCKIGVKKALEISRILAFNASSKNKTVVTLNLPLPAPVTFNPKRKRK